MGYYVCCLVNAITDRVPAVWARRERGGGRVVLLLRPLALLSRSPPPPALLSPRAMKIPAAPLPLFLAALTRVAAQEDNDGTHSTEFDPKYDLPENLLITPQTHPALFSVSPAPPFPKSPR